MLGPQLLIPRGSFQRQQTLTVRVVAIAFKLTCRPFSPASPPSSIPLSSPQQKKELISCFYQLISFRFIYSLQGLLLLAVMPDLVSALFCFRYGMNPKTFPFQQSTLPRWKESQWKKLWKRQHRTHWNCFPSCSTCSTNSFKTRSTAGGSIWEKEVS